MRKTKSLIIAILAITLLMTSLSSAFVENTSDSFKFDETTGTQVRNDVSPNRNLTLTAATHNPGKINNGLNLSVQTARGTVIAQPENGSLTISGWINLIDNDTTDNNQNFTVFEYAVSPNVMYRYQFDERNGQGNPRFSRIDGAGNIMCTAQDFINSSGFLGTNFTNKGDNRGLLYYNFRYNGTHVTANVNWVVNQSNITLAANRCIANSPEPGTYTPGAIVFGGKLDGTNGTASAVIDEFSIHPSNMSAPDRNYLFNQSNGTQYPFFYGVAINSFTANPTTIVNGSSTNISWTTTNATTVLLNGNSVALSGSTLVSPDTNTTYELNVSNSYNQTARATLQVNVTYSAGGGGANGTAPNITSFTTNASSINNGSSIRLNWTVAGVNVTVRLNGINVTVNGTSIQSPVINTTYTLNATNIFGSTTQSLTVTVLYTCTPNYACSSFAACINDTRICLNTTDLNSCGTPYPGNATDFNAACDSTPPYNATYDQNDLAPVIIDATGKGLAGIGSVASIIGITLGIFILASAIYYLSNRKMKK